MTTDKSMTIEDLLNAQYDLQIDSFGLDPINLRGAHRAEFVRWNVLALTDELHEAMQEIKWKPWLTDGSAGEWVNRDAFVGELVDALHFLTNLFLLADATGDEISERYLAKRQVNANRQVDGYSGVKDADGRATDEPALAYDDLVASEYSLNEQLTFTFEAPTPLFDSAGRRYLLMNGTR